MKLFGFTLGKKEVVQNQPPTQPAFTLPTEAIDDGAVNITSSSHFGTYVDLEGSVRNELELITRYREMSNHPELDMAVDEIVNEAISHDDNGKILNIKLDNLKLSDNIKKKILEEFNNIQKMLNFSNISDDLFRRWYIDGRLFFHIIVDEANPKNGIVELRYIDPRKIRKVREIKQEKDPKTGAIVIKSTAEYYVYNDRGTTTQTYTSNVNTGVKIASDSILNINSGLMDAKNTFVISYLHQAIKPLNQLRMIEDAVVIYRLSRASERRIFYIDVGNLPKGKAEQYMQDIMVKYRNKMVYNQQSGELVDQRKHLSMLEDFFLPRREGCLSLDTEIPLLDGREITLATLIIEHNLGKQNWVYSIDNNGHIVPGLISWAGVTRKNTDVLRIHLNNGAIVRATPDHKFILIDGTKIEAKDLKINQELMPFDTWIKNNELRIQHVDTKNWETVDEITENYFSTLPHKLNEDQYYAKIVVEKIEIQPTKIDVGTLTIDEHHEYHDYHNFALSSGIFVMNSKGTEITTLPPGCLSMDTKVSLLDGRELSIKEIENEMSLGNELWTYSCDEFTGEIKPGLISWAGVTQKVANVVKITLDNNESIICTPDHKFPMYNRGFVEAKDLKINDSLIPSTRKKSNLYNHRIISIEYLNDPIEVGTLTIDKNETIHNHHTFALSCGVFTKNSNLGQIEDVVFFRQKLLQALKVPISRLDPQQGGLIGLGRTSEITRDEVKFSKFIDRLRNKFSQLFDDALSIQLALKGICTREEWKQFKDDVYYDYVKDNNFTEMRDADLMRERVNLLTLIEPYIGTFYSKTWVDKNVLRLNEEEVELMKKEIEKDAYNPPNQQNSEQSNQEFDGVDNTQDEDLTPQLSSDVTKYSKSINK